MDRLASPYGLCGVSGVLLGLLYLFIISRNEKGRFEDLAYIYTWSVLGAILGAKVLYLLVESGNIIKTIRAGVPDTTAYLAGLLQGGFVFYGGLIGAVAFGLMGIRFFGVDKDAAVRDLIPVLPLAHAFGRVGCHLVGCCYGREVHVIPGIVYHDSEFAPNGVALFPVQITEAAGDIIIFLILVFLIRTKKDISGYSVMYLYIVMYAVMRFILEFMRGDRLRGFIGVLSVSQWISIIMSGLCVYLFYRRKKNGYRENTGNM